jgi:hypothetical protein
MAAASLPAPNGDAPLEVRRRHLRRRRGRGGFRAALAAAITVVTLAWAILVGLGLLMR